MNVLGFHLVKQGLSDLSDVVGWRQKDQKEFFENTLQDMLPIFANDMGDELKSLTAKYHEYKMKYLKHLNFNPNAENFSKFFLTNFHL